MRARFGIVVVTAFAVACGSNAGDVGQQDLSPEKTPEGADSGTQVQVANEDSGTSTDDAGVTVTDDSGSVEPLVEAGPVVVPCGVGHANKCVLGEGCDVTADCAIGTCSVVTKKCVKTPSCIGTPGADTSCGPGNVDCCLSPSVPGGTFTNVDTDLTVETGIVAGFRMDAFEVTVGRLRAFLRTFDGDLRNHPPLPGAGSHPLVANSGWRSSFNVRLPGSWTEANIRFGFGCAEGGNNEDYGAATWTPEPGPNENKPINCIDWYTLFAFCAWDGGRLPTDNEWAYVALGGAEQRLYPYGSQDPTFATLKDVVASRFENAPFTIEWLFTQGPMYREANHGPLPIAPVGLKTERSPWGQADLSGNVIEMVLDKARALPDTCDNCADVSWPDPPQVISQPIDWSNGTTGSEFSDTRALWDGKRMARGSSWQGVKGGHQMLNSRSRFHQPVWRTYSAIGGRCARN